MFFAVIPCLWRGKYFSSGKDPVENNPATPMLRHLMYKIKSTGPITVAEYMKEVLTNPAKVWVGEPDGQAHSNEFAKSESGGVRLERSQSVFSPGSRSSFQGKNHPEGLGTDKLTWQGWIKSAAVSLRWG